MNKSVGLFVAVLFVAAHATIVPTAMPIPTAEPIMMIDSIDPSMEPMMAIMMSPEPIEATGMPEIEPSQAPGIPEIEPSQAPGMPEIEPSQALGMPEIKAPKKPVLGEKEQTEDYDQENDYSYD